MQFEEELRRSLPSALPNRDNVIAQSARHLKLIVNMNEQFNLTRILDPREAAIKHVVDSVLPWHHFAGSRHVLDAGTGAGFPGIPLALVLPDTQFTLAESTGKKARFVASAVEALGLMNIRVEGSRAEEVLKSVHPNVITGRALAPLSRALPLFADAIRSGARALFYKGPDIDLEIAEAAPQAQKLRLRMHLIARYDLPEAFGTRTLVEIVR